MEDSVRPVHSYRGLHAHEADRWYIVSLTRCGYIKFTSGTTFSRAALPVLNLN